MRALVLASPASHRLLALTLAALLALAAVALAAVDGVAHPPTDTFSLMA